MVYLTEREWLPFTRWRQEKHPRLRLELDGAINVGASHHQKVVVVDEALAFCGGFDLGAWRWDTAGHAVDDPLRETPWGERYQPLHDVQMALAGPVVRDLADLCAARWERAVGEPLRRPERPRADVPWPESVPVDIESVPAATALTFSRFREYAPSRHIERLRLDLIAAARRYLYIENQYLSSHRIVQALIRRLGEPEGPEVIIVLTRDTGGWLEEGTLGVLRDRLLERLHEADRYHRFAAYYPYVEDASGAGRQVYVHAKVLIADDRVIEIGSANLSNRSMKVDSEVDLVLFPDQPANAARRLLARLLGIHFARPEEAMLDRLDASGPLIPCIEALRDGSRHRLEPLDYGANGPVQKRLADTQLLDPDEPISPAYWMREMVRETQVSPQEGRRDWRRYRLPVACVAGGIVMAVLLKHLWGGTLDQDLIVAWLDRLRGNPAALPITWGAFFLAGLVAVPINLLLVACTLALGPGTALGCGLTGSLASAAAAFVVGRHAGRPLLKRFAKDKLDVLARSIGHRGPLSVALIRILPVAPFAVVNLVAGFSGLSLRVFLLGSVLGMVPGMLAVVWVTQGAVAAIADPGWRSWLGLAAAMAVCGGAALYLHRVVAGKARDAG